MSASFRLYLCTAAFAAASTFPASAVPQPAKPNNQTHLLQAAAAANSRKAGRASQLSAQNHLRERARRKQQEIEQARLAAAKRKAPGEKDDEEKEPTPAVEPEPLPAAPPELEIKGDPLQPPAQ